ncbi:pyridoxamine 5'-phosphate oxidase family protein [Mesoterricola sediminis]|uniref:Pyridoxamine 5'-phosphate oxidase family protein n=1 Tax=Mesoterricola sediminis TaxID=2927980 RepID=A0AA48H643_9BACT|nr:pyridoxamine 5'-phosphate oxidase family protein [Mesoterricola sediminis]BDU78076.1 hypothetical protein METESE_30340 [Mesoterricola sediminis]
MRRQEKDVTDTGLVDQLLSDVAWGTLGLARPGGPPALVPLDFAARGDRLWFHGSAEGEKMDLIRAGGEATFCVVDPLAIIPSTVSDPERACPATQYFRSVILEGRVTELKDPARKAEALQALMEKLQPEGGFRAITAGDPLYAGSVAHVAVLEMRVTRVTAKAETGARLTPEKRARVLDLLERRGTETDLRTLAAMGGRPGSPASS